MTFAAFSKEMDRLAGLKFKPATLVTHWEALNDLHDASLRAAIERAARECDEFPSPKMLRAFVPIDRIVGPDEDRSTPLPEPKVFQFPQGGRDIRIEREWTYYCNLCQDGGWQSWHCDANGACGRDTCPYPHEYVKRCACWDSNPALLKKREKMAQQAQTRTTKQ